MLFDLEVNHCAFSAARFASSLVDSLPTTTLPSGIHTCQDQSFAPTCLTCMHLEPSCLVSSVKSPLFHISRHLSEPCPLDCLLVDLPLLVGVEVTAVDVLHIPVVHTRLVGHVIDVGPTIPG